MAILLFLVALVLLVVGAELLVRGAAQLAFRVGISPLVVGLTVVAFGTSAPEMAVSVKGALVGQAAIALGNVVGSNIFNVLAILGLSALVVPLTVSSRLLRADVPLMIGISCAMLALGWNGEISRLEGIVLFTGIVIYTVVLIYLSRKETVAAQAQLETPPPTGRRLPIVLDLAFIVAGLAMLVLGSRWLVNSAIMFAQWLGVSELVIGLTVVAAGTSLPELVTSVVAGLRGERDIAVGNIVGSNIFNILAVLGMSAIVAPDGVEVARAALSFDIPVMIAVAFICLPIFFTGGGIARWEGGLLLAMYAIYTTYLILAATQHDALATFETVVLWFVIPPVILMLTGCTLAGWRQRGADDAAS